LPVPGDADPADYVTDTGAICDRLDPLVKLDADQYVRLTTTGQNIPSNAATALAWTLGSSPSSMFNSAQPTRVTCSVTGLYAFFCSGSWQANPVNTYLALSANGTEAQRTQLIGQWQAPFFTGFWPLGAGSYWEFIAYQNGGAQQQFTGRLVVARLGVGT